MAKCETKGCHNTALSGSKYCIECRDSKNSTKDATIKVVASVGVIILGIVAAVAGGRRGSLA